MPFLGLMTVRAHEAAVADLLAEQAEQRTYWRKDTQAERETVGRLIKDKAALLTEASALRAQLATLRPDAEKHRERVRKASMNLKQNRAKAGVVA